MLAVTRDALHSVARLVLASELEGTTDLVTLRITPGGFGQPERLVDGLQRRVRVDGTTLVVQHGQDERWTPLTTLAAAAEQAGVALPADAPAADLPLSIDAADATTLARFFAFTDDALAVVRRRHAAERPTIAQLFPHHFDLAVTIGEVNVGGSPGDPDHELPYLYVGPWNVQPHDLWNEPWGASMPWDEHISLDQAIDFFESRLAAARE